MTEQFANDAQTTLDGAIDDTVAVLNVADASLFPTTGDFRIRVEDEYMLVTGVNAEEFTVERAAEGSVAAPHADTTTVTHVLTAGGLTSRMAFPPVPVTFSDDDGNYFVRFRDVGSGDDRIRNVDLYQMDGSTLAFRYAQSSVNSGLEQTFIIGRNNGEEAIIYEPEAGFLNLFDSDGYEAVIIDPFGHKLSVFGVGVPFADFDALNQLFSLNGWMDLTEQPSAPAAPPADTARLYTEDLGGKTALYVRFPTGTPVKIAEEP